MLGITDRRRVKKEKYNSVKDVFHSLGVQTSLHGIPRILSSKHWYQRGLWTCLVLLTFGFLVFQIYQLVHEYTKYPIQTKVSIKMDTLKFPSVSLCNMNPVKTSSLSLIAHSTLHDYIAPKSRLEITNEKINRKTNSPADNNLTDDLNDLYATRKTIIDTFRESYIAFTHYSRALNENWSKGNLITGFRMFEFLYQNQSKQSRKEWGHSIQDMLITCSFNGKQCFANNFTLFQTTDYGNCYTLSSDLFISINTGPIYGLQMILQVEKFELLNKLFDGTGFRLVIHEPGTFPFPEKEGYTISPGYETIIGMRMVRVMRAEPPYGTCDSGDVFFKTYGCRYSVKACLEICRFQKVVEICKCRPLDNAMDIKFMEKFKDVPVCSAMQGDTYEGL